MDFSPGFLAAEATDAINLCMQLNGTGLTGQDPPKLGGRWANSFDSRRYDPQIQETIELADGTAKTIVGMGPFDNAWGLWQGVVDKGLYAVVIRGTVDNANSILEDALATTVFANGALNAPAPDGGQRHLLLATVSADNAQNAAVHLGFIWGAAILLYHKDLGILNQLGRLPAGSRVLITGHSQGAAIATLLHALLLHASTADGVGALANVLKPKRFRYKSYVFAQPRPGNWQFGHDFAQVAGNRGFALCLNNSRDWVPQVPLSIDLPDQITGNPIDPYLESRHPLIKQMADIAGAGAHKIRAMVSDIANHRSGTAATYLGAHIDANEFLIAGAAADNGAPYLNYVQCGRLYSLSGKPSPNEASDALWQHHCGNYGSLLKEQSPDFA